MDPASSTELRALKADSFGRISLMQGPQGPFVRRDLAHVPLWLRLPAWWLARREALALRSIAGMADVPQLLAWDGRRLDRSYMEGAAMYQRPPRGDVAWFRAARRLLLAHRIPVHSESLFGVGHRQIVFDVASGDVWVRQTRTP